MPPQDVPAMDGVAQRPVGGAQPGPEAIRRALSGPAGRVALILPAPAGPARRRVAVALLATAGRAQGGSVLETPDGDLLLTEAAAPEAERVAATLARLMGAPPGRVDLPEGGARLLALPSPVPVQVGQPPPPAAAGIEALADAAPLPGLLRRDGVLHIAAGVPRRLALLRLRLSPGALAPHLGPAAADADLARHARDRLRARVLAMLADAGRREALLGQTPPVPLLIDLPSALLPDPPPHEGEPPGPPALIAALSLAEAMAEGLTARRAALHHAGWGLAVRGLDAGSLALLAPDALPADLLLLRWSPALGARAVAAALRRTNPACLVLTGCDGPEALEWGLATGVSRFAGPWIAALMAATRMATCPGAAACTRGQCAGRAAAASPEARAGCTQPALLGALVPA